ncbi:hypothetical protein [Blastomonas sp. AAP25]|uniref:hypothetical protein n=1 Tax=Blastomonas sp. AAP25 TaxID=1523416 RepID=UPI0006B93A09|nr:hypothetical protein [Blastomonas sp. AAP25]
MADNRKFIADVGAAVRKRKGLMLQVAQESIQDVVRLAQTPVARGGSMPVDEGGLINSLVTELRGAQVGQGEDSYTLGIAGLRLGDAFQVAWTAPYAIARHYKPESFGQGGGLWRDKAAQQWQRIVASNAAKVS